MGMKWSDIGRMLVLMDNSETRDPFPPPIKEENRKFRLRSHWAVHAAERNSCVFQCNFHLCATHHMSSSIAGPASCGGLRCNIPSSKLIFWYHILYLSSWLPQYRSTKTNYSLFIFYYFKNKTTTMKFIEINRQVHGENYIIWSFLISMGTWI